jgi:hypothetical protein
MAERRAPEVTKDINVLALVKGKERYIFLFDDDNRAEALRTLGRYASNQELSFTWYDAAVLSQKIRQTVPPPKRTIPVRRFELRRAPDPRPGDDLV